MQTIGDQRCLHRCNQQTQTSDGRQLAGEVATYADEWTRRIVTRQPRIQTDNNRFIRVYIGITVTMSVHTAARLGRKYTRTHNYACIWSTTLTSLEFLTRAYGYQPNSAIIRSEIWKNLATDALVTSSKPNKNLPLREKAILFGKYIVLFDYRP